MKTIRLDLANLAIFGFWALWSFLSYHHYSLLKPEVFSACALFIFPLFLFWLILFMVRATWIFYGMLLFLWLDLIGGLMNESVWQADLWKSGRGWILLFAGSPAWSLLTAGLFRLSQWTEGYIRYTYAVTATVLLVLSYLGRKKIARVVYYGFFMLSFAAVLQGFVFAHDFIQVTVNEVKEAAVRPENNILVLAVDEHIGIEGMPPLEGEGSKLKEQLIRDYTKLGFDVYGGAFSNYRLSNRSFPNILNYAVLSGKAKKGPIQMRRNRLFEKWLNDGYRLHIYQGEYIDFCSSFSHDYKKCVRYKDNSIHTIQDTDLPVREKTWMILSSYAEAHHSWFVKSFMRDLMTAAGYMRKALLSPLTVERILPLISDDIGAGTAGNVYFAHLLLPHFPYAYDSGCQLKKFQDWEFGSDHGKSSWNEKYRNYYEQTHCLHLQLKGLFDLMQETGVFDRTLILVFGDHGSRIESDTFEHDDRPLAQDRKVVDSYSSLLLIKPAGASEGRYIARKDSVVNLIHEVTGLSPQKGFSREDFQQRVKATA